MYSRWYEVAVVLLWLATMSWLVTRKVLPALLVGEPPDSRAILEAQQDDLPTCWSMAWEGRPLGWALSTTSLQLDGSTKVRSRVHFDELPLHEMIPGWLELILPPLDEVETQLQMETQSILVFNSEGQLSSFQSSVQFQPGVDAIEVRGSIDGALVSVSIHSGNLTYQTEVSVPRKAMLGDALSPQALLPDLHTGQTWTVKLFSPLRPPSSPMEILQAKVEGVQPMSWNGRAVDTWLVTYRSDPGSVLGSTDKPREQLWVHPDGTVLKQEVTILDSTMTFVRLPDEEAAALAKKVADQEQAAAEVVEP